VRAALGLVRSSLEVRDTGSAGAAPERPGPGA